MVLPPEQCVRGPPRIDHGASAHTPRPDGVVDHAVLVERQFVVGQEQVVAAATRQRGRNLRIDPVNVRVSEEGVDVMIRAAERALHQDRALERSGGHN